MWEYKSVGITDSEFETKANYYSREGWEIVTVLALTSSWWMLLLKRKIS